jgi:DUF1680 family protein
MSLEPDKLFCPLFCFSIVLYRIESNAYLTLYRQESQRALLGFSINLRIPGWGSRTEVSLNGTRVNGDF